MMTFDTKNKSSNVSVCSYNDLARRISDFKDAIVTSKQSIKPGQVFSIKINETDKVYDGNLRIGFSILPDGILFPLPSYSIPDLVDRGGTWIWAIGDDVDMEKGADGQGSFTIERFQSTERCNLGTKQPGNECQCCLSTSYGVVPLYQLMSECMNSHGGRCARQNPGSVGSIISIYYDVRNVEGCEFNDQCNVLEAADLSGERITPDPSSPFPQSFNRLCFKYTFHILVNGQLVNVNEDLVFVNLASKSKGEVLNPYQYLPEMRAVVDVYGSTKSVQILTLDQTPVKSLQDMCVHEMIKACGYEHLSRLPKSLRNHLQLQMQKLIHQHG